MTLQTTTVNAEATGYAAYWDGYAFQCMDGLLAEDALAAWKRGFVEARMEARGK